MANLACITNLKIKNSNGLALAYFPDSALLATRGGQSQKVVFHETQPCPPLRRMDIIAGNDKVGSKDGEVNEGLRTTTLRDGMMDPLTNRTIADITNRTGAIEVVMILQTMTPNLVAISDPNSIVIRNVDDGSLVYSNILRTP
jgi:hypothetical protein